MNARTLIGLVTLLIIGCDAEPRPLVGFGDTISVTDTGEEPEDTGEEPEQDIDEEPEDVESDVAEDTGDEPDTAEDTTQPDTAEISGCVGCTPGQICRLDDTCADKGTWGTCVPEPARFEVSPDTPTDVYGLTIGGKNTYTTTSESACTVEDWSGEGDDAIVKLTVEEDRRYTVRVVESDFQAGLIVRRYVSNCAPTEPDPSTPEDGGAAVAPPNCYGAALADSAGAPVRVSFTATESDETWVIVDGAEGESGIWHLQITTCDNCPDSFCNDTGECGVANSTCAQPLPLTLGEPLAGDTTDAGDDYYDLAAGTTSQSACSDTGVAPSAGGADVTFSHEAAEAGEYRFTVSDATFDSYLMVTLGSCDGDLSAVCQGRDDNPDGTGEQVTVTLAEGETAYAIVDGVGAEAKGTFQIQVERIEE